MHSIKGGGEAELRKKLQESLPLEHPFDGTVQTILGRTTCMGGGGKYFEPLRKRKKRNLLKNIY